MSLILFFLSIFLFVSFCPPHVSLGPGLQIAMAEHVEILRDLLNQRTRGLNEQL